MIKEHTITIKDTDGLGQDFTIDLEKPFVIGRGQNCDVLYPKDGLSREHLKVEFEQNKFIITDLGATNGSYVDEVKVEREKTAQVYSFNQVVIANLYTLDLNFAGLPKTEQEVSASYSQGLNDFKVPRHTSERTSINKRMQKSRLVQKKSNARKDFRARNKLINFSLFAILISAAVYNIDKITSKFTQKKLSPNTLVNKNSTELSSSEKVAQPVAAVAKQKDDKQIENNIKLPQIDPKLFAKHASCNTRFKNSFCYLFKSTKAKSYGIVWKDYELIFHLDFNRYRQKHVKGFESNSALKNLIVTKFNMAAIKRLKDKNIKQFDIFFTTPIFSKFKTVKHVKIDLESFFNNPLMVTAFGKSSSNSDMMTFTDKDSFIKMQNTQGQPRETNPSKQVSFKQIAPVLKRVMTINP